MQAEILLDSVKNLSINLQFEILDGLQPHG